MKRQHSRQATSVRDNLPEYVFTGIDQRMLNAAIQQMAGALGRATFNMSTEDCDEWAMKLRHVNRATLLPDGCHLSAQSRVLFNLLVRKKGRATILRIARRLWPKEYEHKGWADLDSRSKKYKSLGERIKKVQQRLGEQRTEAVPGCPRA